MTLHLLPNRCGSAAENMASDFLLLQRYPASAAPVVRLRHYSWLRPSFTFGYGQKIALIREHLDTLAPHEPFDLVRRVTGGGLVDHRNGWTYALVIPRGHDLEKQPAPQSYKIVHDALAFALRQQGVDAAIKPEAPLEEVPETGVCFSRAERFDVIHERKGGKIAGAAQKRTKHGLLFQGSVSRSAVGDSLDWEAFYAAFATELARALKVEPQETAWPDFAEDELEGLIEQYSSPEWLNYR